MLLLLRAMSRKALLPFRHACCPNPSPLLKRQNDLSGVPNRRGDDYVVPAGSAWPSADRVWHTRLGSQGSQDSDRTASFPLTAIFPPSAHRRGGTLPSWT